MLQTIRDRVSGPIVWAIIALIAIPFAFVGIESFQGVGSDPTVAKVGDQKITASQLEAAYQQRLQRLQQMLGESFRSDMIEPERFREGVLLEMIQETALQQHAVQSGYSASDAAIVESIRTIPAFQKEGQFSADLYREALARQGLEPQGFERQLREGLSVDQIRDGVLASAFVTPAEAAAAWRLARQERQFSSVSFKAADYESLVSISGDDIEKYFAENSDRYKAPERLKLNVVELDLAKLPEAAAPESAVLKALYDADIASFSTSEERRASHILVSFGADKAEALQKAEGIKAKLDAKADFAALASESSDDPGSKASGGDLGWIRKGLMTPKFEESLFSLQPGEISAPVETEFGWHLIKLDEVKPAVTRAFEDSSVQAELLARYRKADVEKRFQSLAERVDELAFEKNSTLQPVAELLGTTVETTDWFTRTSGSGLTANEAVQQAAFSQEVLQDGENSKPISLGPNRIAVIRKAEYEPARARTLDEVRDQVGEELKRFRAAELAKSEAEKLIRAVTEGTSIEAAAAQLQKVSTSQSAVRRDAQELPRQLVDAAFRLPRPAAGKVSVGKADLANGELVVIALTEVRDATPETDDVAFKQQSTQLKDALAGSEFVSFRADLERRLGVERKNVPVPEAPATAP